MPNTNCPVCNASVNSMTLIRSAFGLNTRCTVCQKPIYVSSRVQGIVLLIVVVSAVLSFCLSFDQQQKFHGVRLAAGLALGIFVSALTTIQFSRRLESPEHGVRISMKAVPWVAFVIMSLLLLIGMKEWG